MAAIRKYGWSQLPPLSRIRNCGSLCPHRPTDSEPVIYLTANDLGDRSEGGVVIWQQPRLEFKPNASGITHPPILLQDVQQLVTRIDSLIERELPRTRLYLNAVAGLRDADLQLEQIASANQLNLALLKQWVELLGLGGRRQREIHGQFTNQLSKAGGNAALNGWGFDQTPNMLTNQSTEDIRVSTLTVPARGIVMHPSPTQESIAAWRSPINGHVTLAGLVADSDANCGNGVAWRVELHTESGIAKLVDGIVDNGGEARIQPTGEIHVRCGDVVSLIVNSRDGNHACDTTHVALTFTEVANQESSVATGEVRTWDLASDTVDRIDRGNPLPDAYGHADTWHFAANDAGAKLVHGLVPGSTLALWRASFVGGQSADELARLGETVQQSLVAQDSASLTEADRTLREQLLDWKGPLRWITAAGELTDLAADSQSNRNDAGADLAGANSAETKVYGVPAEMFGKASNWRRHRRCKPVPASTADYRVSPTSRPDYKCGLRSFRRTAWPSTSQAGSVQVQATSVKPSTLEINPALPILVSSDSTATIQIESAMAEFRSLFPAALCYLRIVPVDEVVTMTLFFREDEPLQRLMLSETQIAELDRCGMNCSMWLRNRSH